MLPDRSNRMFLLPTCRRILQPKPDYQGKIYNIVFDEINQTQSIRYARQAKRYSQISIVSGALIHITLLYYVLYKVLANDTT